MIKVFDNILDENEKDKIEGFLRDPAFPWYLANNNENYTTDKSVFDSNKDENTVETTLLGHDFYRDNVRVSENYLVSDIILDRFLQYTGHEFKAKVRSKANLQLASSMNSDVYTTPHFDLNFDHYVLLYYPVSSTGNTVIFKEKRNENLKNYNVLEEVQPKKGRYLLFDGNHYHAVRHVTENNLRLTVNIGFI